MLFIVMLIVLSLRISIRLIYHLYLISANYPAIIIFNHINSHFLRSKSFDLKRKYVWLYQEIKKFIKGDII